MLTPTISNIPRALVVQSQEIPLPESAKSMVIVEQHGDPDAGIVAVSELRSMPSPSDNHFGPPTAIQFQHTSANVNNRTSNLLEGTTIVAACRNRNDQLKRTMTTWFRADDVKEVIVVDWGSDSSVALEVSQIMSENLRAGTAC